MNERSADASEAETYQSYLAAASTLEQIGLKLNDRIEVKWTIEHDTPPSSVKRWWGARLIASSSDNPRLLTLLYDRYEDFEESRSQVLLLTEQVLYDIDAKDELYWRREGDLVDSTDFEEFEKDVVTIQDLVDANEDMEQVPQSALEALPHTVQIQVAERLAKFNNGLVEFLKEKAEERGPNALIKVEDVEDFVSKMKDWDKKNP